MKKVLIIVWLFTFSAANAQEVIKSIYGDSLIVYRLSNKKISKIKYQVLLDAIMLFEKQLDKTKAKVTKGNDLANEDFAFYKTIIKDNDAKFDLSGYDAEIAFYKSYSKKREVEVKRLEDSLQVVKTTNYEIEQQNKIFLKDSLYQVAKSLDSTQQLKFKDEKLFNDNYVGGRYNEKLIIISGYSFNNVANYLNRWIVEDFNFTPQDGGKDLPHQITIPFKPKVTSSLKKGFTTKYFLSDDGKVNNLTIQGYYYDVINFFVSYWPTTIKFEDAVKKETAVKYLITDKITLTVYIASKTAKIEIEKNR